MDLTLPLEALRASKGRGADRLGMGVSVKGGADELVVGVSVKGDADELGMGVSVKGMLMGLAWVSL